VAIFFVWHHAIFCVAEAKQVCGTGRLNAMVQRIATREKKDFHTMTLSRVESWPLPHV